MTNENEVIDLFENHESLPEKVQQMISDYTELLESGNGNGYTICKSFQADIKKLGYTFEYGLDGVPFNLQESKAPSNKWASSPSP